MTPIQYAKQICYSSPEVLDFSHDMGLKYKDSPGIFVECGTAAGAQVIAMRVAAPDKIIYVFDSFEGICHPSNRDNQMPGIKWLSEWEQKALPDPGKHRLETTGVSAVSLPDFLNNLVMSGVGNKNVYAIVGWFENTVEEEAKHIDEISLLRLDGDLYNSTWVCLQHLFPKVIQGGCVIIDDYELLGCRDACKEYFELIGYEPDYKFIEGKDYRVAYFFK